MAEVVLSGFAAFGAQHASQAKFPPEARQRAVDAIGDCIACQLAGSRQPIADMVLATIPSAPVPSSALPASLVGRPGHAGPADAALFGGAIAHALDYDDTNHPGYAHPSAVLVPAMLAAAHLTKVTGADLVTAYIVGFDLIGKLGRALNTDHYELGWHATKTFGTPAAALAAGLVLGLDVRQLETAMAIAVSSSSGLRANFGTMVKPLHAGQAAQAGVSAALLAREGFTANREAMEHKYGFMALFGGAAGGDIDWLRRPGDPLEILTSEGLALKPYPSCGATHPAIEAALRVRERLGSRTIARVKVGASRLSFAPLIYSQPANGLEAKFSMQFCVAAALATGRITLDSFDMETLNHPLVTDLMARMTVETDPRVADSLEFGAVVSVVTHDGQEVSEMVELASGKPAHWFSEAKMKGKFLECSKGVLQPEDAVVFFERLRAFDTPTPVQWFFKDNKPKGVAADPAAGARQYLQADLANS